MRDFRNLDVWHKSHAFTLLIYQTTEVFPKAETYGLSASLRRLTAQMTMKIAEACGKDQDDDFKNGLLEARGMWLEVEYQLLLARDLHFIKSGDYESVCHKVIEVRRMLSGLMKAVVV